MPNRQYILTISVILFSVVCRNLQASSHLQEFSSDDLKKESIARNSYIFRG